MVDMRPEHRPVATTAVANGLPFDVWWAIGEASAAALLVAALRLLGLI